MSNEIQSLVAWSDMRANLRRQIQVARDNNTTPVSVKVGPDGLAIIKTQLKRRPAALTHYDAEWADTLTIFGLPVIKCNYNVLEVVTGQTLVGNKDLMFGKPNIPKAIFENKPTPEPIYLPEGREVQI
jgi:hypothetical protein